MFMNNLNKILAISSFLFLNSNQASWAKRVTESMSKNKLPTSSKAINEVMNNPVKTSPFTWAQAAAELFQAGFKKNAAFCYYVFQARSLPHVKVDKDPSAGPALRASLKEVIGKPINEWLGQDFNLMYSVGKAAIEFESTLDQTPLKPSHVEAKEWEKTVKNNRNEYKKAFINALGTKEKREKMTAMRKENDLSVAPLKDLDTPLKSEWEKAGL